MLMLLLAVTTDPPAPTPTPPPVKCETITFHLAANTGTARIRSLVEEPLARQERAVAYSEQGCLKPVTVAENVGK
ncbi:hypothetical protein ACFQ15_06595 [Sphingomonas hankookensis]|uniref:hypothetical protein n=1 Tax=Sphingomonas hankookensis TaxID=563996 RepID=UPI001F560BFC|nr:hypothetical protein [Sphingomonas hankookensis]